jgi:threonyl-tRNA synthetase
LEEGGFFYDMSLGNDRTLSQDDYKGIEDVAKMAVKEKQPFERLELPKEVLLEMFKVGTLTLDAFRMHNATTRTILMHSTTSTNNTTSTTRSPTAPRPLFTAVGPSSTCVSVPTSPTPAVSSLLP